MQVQRFAAIEKVQIQFAFRISAYLKTADKFNPPNYARKAPLIGPGKLRSKIGDALLAALFDRVQLFATSSETVATQLGTSQHVRHAFTKRFRRQLQLNYCPGFEGHVFPQTVNIARAT